MKKGNLIIVAGLIVFISFIDANSAEDFKINGLIKIPSIISYSDIKISLLNFNFQEVIKETKVNDDGHFIINGLSKQPYIFIIRIEKYSQEIWRGINLEKNNTSIIFDIKDELLSRIQKNSEELRWMLRSIKHHPLREDVSVMANKNNFSPKKLLPLDSYISYIINTGFDDKIGISQLNIAFSGRIHNDVDWYIASFLNSEKGNLVNTKGGFSYKNIEGHNLSTEITYLEHKIYRYDDIISEEVRDSSGKNFSSSILFSDNWHALNFLDVNYSFQFDYLSFIKNSFQSGEKILLNFFPNDQVSIYSEISNSKKTYLKIIEENFNNSWIMSNLDLSLDGDAFKPQKDVQTEVGLILKPKKNLNFQLGVFNLFSKDRIAFYRTLNDLINLINAGDVRLEGLSLSFYNKYGNWLEGELSYKIIKNEGVSMDLDDSVYGRIDSPEKIYQLRAKLLAKSQKTSTSLSIFYTFQNGIYLYNNFHKNNYHLLNLEIKQKLPNISNFNKCNIEVLFLLQNILSNDFYKEGLIDYDLILASQLPKSLAGGLIFYF